MLTVKDVYQKKFVSVPSEMTIREIAAVMASNKSSHVLVENGGSGFVGLVTEADFVRKVTAGDLVPYVTKASDVMSSPLISVDINTTTHQALDMMDTRGVLHLAVRDQNNVVGTVSVRDLIHNYESPESGGKCWP